MKTAILLLAFGIAYVTFGIAYVTFGITYVTFGITYACEAQSSDLLNAIFQDHAVLQRDRPIRIRGTARPGDTVTVSLGEVAATAEAADDAEWSATLPAMAAGGPFTLEVSTTGGRRQTVVDILAGDVFLCSGQSNMAWPVNLTLNADTEISASANDRIRMLDIPLAASPHPLASFSNPITWEVAAPETVGEWSAVCYYFARELQKHVDVPIGLINSSWGGSNIRAWMSESALSKVGDYDTDLALLRLYTENPPVAQAAFGEKWQQFWRDAPDHSADVPWQPGTGRSWPPAPEGLGNYKEWREPDLRDYHGMLWFRATTELTSGQAKQDARLSLGAVDEVDQTWINGHVVGNTFGWGTERTYRIPSDLLREGENVIVVNVLNTWGAGGMVGDPELRAIVFDDGTRVPLDDWRYKTVSTRVGHPPRAPWESVSGLSTIHNAMVAPLWDYGLAVVLWYQGESNTGEARRYRTLLETLMGQWRGQFGDDLPVLVVQLANFGPPSSAPVESGWAEVREAQRLATQDDDRAALVVTIDVGEAADIHPRNKQDVGRRLARAARSVVYGELVIPSGPVAVSAVREGETITVVFDDVQESLVLSGDATVTGFETCGAGNGSCEAVDARVDGSTVILTGVPERAAERVRYCWADNPVCPLFDGSGLPAGPFEIAVRSSRAGFSAQSDRR